METKFYTMEEKKEMIKDFLLIPKEFKKYLKKDEVIWIYKIINLVNDKVYVGKTKNMNQRAHDYLNNYLKGLIDTKIDKAINEIGIDKFIMSPLEVAFNPESGSIKERYYIDLYDTIENGYNITINSINPNKRQRTREKKIPTKQTIYSKLAKSKLCVGVNDSKNEIIFSTGLKLFGDYISRSKDEIKSAARRETRLEGYFIYYLNKKDFDEQIKSAEMKIEKNKPYKDKFIQYPDFIKYSNIIIDLLKHNTEKFSDEFTIKFITQANTKSGYKFVNPDEFISKYQNFTNKII